MIDLYQELIANQYEAALCMLASTIRQCPEENWHAPVANMKFCQVPFHALFFADLYLGWDVRSQRDQSFHQTHVSTFADYEELENRPQQAVYEKLFINQYLQHCREKAAKVVAGETVETLQRRPGFEWLEIPRAEVHMLNVRHLQHHAAQLSLRLRLDTKDGIPWATSGWRDPT